MTLRVQLLRADARVLGIAQVHRALCRGAREGVVEFGGYLRDLCGGVGKRWSTANASKWWSTPRPFRYR